MSNETLESVGIETADLMKPITNIVFIMKSGAQIGVGTPLSTEDFAILYNNKWKRKIKIATGANSYAEINKRNVDFYHVFPAKN